MGIERAADSHRPECNIGHLDGYLRVPIKLLDDLTQGLVLENDPPRTPRLILIQRRLRWFFEKGGRVDADLLAGTNAYGLSTGGRTLRWRMFAAAIYDNAAFSNRHEDTLVLPINIELGADGYDIGFIDDDPETTLQILGHGKIYLPLSQFNKTFFSVEYDPHSGIGV